MRNVYEDGTQSVLYEGVIGESMVHERSSQQRLRAANTRLWVTRRATTINRRSEIICCTPHCSIQFNSQSHGTMTLTQQARPQAPRAAIGGHSQSEVIRDSSPNTSTHIGRGLQTTSTTASVADTSHLASNHRNRAPRLPWPPKQGKHSTTLQLLPPRRHLCAGQATKSAMACTNSFDCPDVH